MLIQALVIAVVLGTAVPGPSGAAERSAAGIRLSPPVGPPTTRVTVKGRGFLPDEGVRLLFDDGRVRLAEADGTGRFSSGVRVPRRALPGDHLVAAVGQISDRRAEAAFTVRTDWPRFHFDLRNTGLNPYENVLGTGNVGDLVERWSAPTGSIVTGSPAVVDGVVYVGVSDGPFLALDASTGSVKWSRVLDQTPTHPTVVGGTVYVGSEEVLYALDADTGAVRWTKSMPSRIFTAVAVVDGIAYLAPDDLYALDAATGTTLWSAPLSGGLSAPAVAGGLLYLGAHDSELHAFDATTGAEVWAAPTGSSISSSPAVAGGMVYVGSKDNKLHAFDSATGDEVWSFTTGDDVDSSPAVAGGMVYVGSQDHNVYALDALTGDPVWTVTTGDWINLASPVVANGVVYIGSNDGNMYALDAESGEILWTYRTGETNTTPAVADGVLYVGSFADTFYAFGLP